MTLLDDITAQRQRLAERLARVDAERVKLAELLGELDAAERVLSRLTPTKAAAGRRGNGGRQKEAAVPTAAAPQARGRRPRRAEAAKTATISRRGRRATATGRKARTKPEVPLSDATLRAVEALGDEASAEQIREYIGREFGIQVRSNHLGMALQRHRRAGRLQENSGKWSLVSPELQPHFQAQTGAQSEPDEASREQ